jgi:HemY protein
MRRLIVILLFLIASVWLGVTLARNPGYVLFTYGQWVIEMPLWTLCLGLLFIFVLLHYSLRFLSFIKNLDTRLSEWFMLRRRNKAIDKTHRGFLSLMEQQWSSAERHLLDGIRQSKNPVVNYLAAAEAAHFQKAYERSDAYLQKAHEVAPQQEVVIGLVQAKLQMEQGHLEQAMATLTHLRQVAPQHVGVLRLLEKMYIRTSDWQNLLGLLPALRKTKLLNSNQVIVFEKNIYCAMLDEAERKNKSIHAVRELWSHVPKKIRLQPDVLERYAKLLKGDKASAEEIEPLIRKVLQKEWHESLAKVYGSLTTQDPMRQLSIAESWTKHYGKPTTLLLTLGRLCLRCQLWGKARQYLEEGLKQEANSETQLELAKLLEHLGETKLALRHYKDGLELATTP